MNIEPGERYLLDGILADGLTAELPRIRVHEFLPRSWKAVSPRSP